VRLYVNTVMSFEHVSMSVCTYMRVPVCVGTCMNVGGREMEDPQVLLKFSKDG
jgi:hypothetical protein